LGTIPLQQSATGFKTVNIHLSTPVDVPNSFTWTAEFSGLSGSEVAGLPIFDPPTVGDSGIDFWKKEGANWTVNLLDNGNIPANFNARFVAIPEPSTLALGLLGGLGVLGYLARRRS
jgi:hypothetical protein